MTKINYGQGNCKLKEQITKVDDINYSKNVFLELR